MVTSAANIVDCFKHLLDDFMNFIILTSETVVELSGSIFKRKDCEGALTVLK